MVKIPGSLFSTCKAISAQRQRPQQNRYSRHRGHLAKTNFIKKSESWASFPATRRRIGNETSTEPKAEVLALWSICPSAITDIMDTVTCQACRFNMGVAAQRTNKYSREHAKMRSLSLAELRVLILLLLCAAKGHSECASLHCACIIIVYAFLFLFCVGLQELQVDILQSSWRVHCLHIRRVGAGAQWLFGGLLSLHWMGHLQI